MLFRPVREFLDEAMKEVRNWDTLEELKKLLPSYVDKEGKIEFTDQGEDKRIGWRSYLLSVDGVACGHTDGKVEISGE